MYIDFAEQLPESFSSTLHIKGLAPSLVHGTLCGQSALSSSWPIVLATQPLEHCFVAKHVALQNVVLW